MKKGLMLAVLVAAALILAACGGGSDSESPAAQTEGPAAPAARAPVGEGALPELETQSSDEGQVVVDVTPRSPGGETWDFEVEFNTHSVDLGFDPAEISVLRCDRGDEFQALAWDGAGPGGHHRSGVLTFAALDHPVSSVELVVRDVAQVPERLFRWDVGLE
ncbi:MAG TPA: hypothetical protein VLC95_11140 [Anaerolineae bacterium]|nr:hypothetical protein [Anaerolineae bacterium]